MSTRTIAVPGRSVSTAPSFSPEPSPTGTSKVHDRVNEGEGEGEGTRISKMTPNALALYRIG